MRQLDIGLFECLNRVLINQRITDSTLGFRAYNQRIDVQKLNFILFLLCHVSVFVYRLRRRDGWKTPGYNT